MVLHVISALPLRAWHAVCEQKHFIHEEAMNLVTGKLTTSSSPRQKGTDLPVYLHSKTTDRLRMSNLVIGGNNTNLICAALYLN